MSESPAGLFLRLARQAQNRKRLKEAPDPEALARNLRCQPDGTDHMDLALERAARPRRQR